MKRLLVVMACGIGLAACGSSSQVKSLQNDPTAKQDEAKAQAIYHKCVKDPTVLRTKTGRHTALQCAIPPQNQTAALKCEVNGLLGHVPTQARIIKITLNCIGRYA